MAEGHDTDIVDLLTGPPPGSPLPSSSLPESAPVDLALVALRNRRPEAKRHTEGAYRALIDPAIPGGVTLGERAAVARRVAELNADAALTAHYAALAAESGEAPSPRLTVILRHADRLTLEPRAATPADLDQLRAAGLGEREIVTVSQLVAFVSHQVRLLAGLRLLGATA